MKWPGIRLRVANTLITVIIKKGFGLLHVVVDDGIRRANSTAFLQTVIAHVEGRELRVDGLYYRKLLFLAQSLEAPLSAHFVRFNRASMA